MPEPEIPRDELGATGAANGMGSTEGLIVAIVAWIAVALINIANAVHR
jgi:hypothetical protein